MPFESMRIDSTPREGVPMKETALELLANASAKNEKKTCAKAIDDFESLGEFSSGLVAGAINGAEGFIEFFATPNALNKAIGGFATAAGGALETAGEYYFDKVVNGKLGDVGTDAGTAAEAVGDWLTEYGEKDPQDRGKVVGELAFGLLLAEAGAGIARSVPVTKMRAQTVALQSNSNLEFEKFVQRLVEAGDETAGRVKYFGPSQGFAAEVDALVNELPNSLKEFLHVKDVKIASIKEIGAMRPEFRGAFGLFLQIDGQPATIWLAENMHTAGDIVNVRRLELTLRHEVTHAVDARSRARGFISDAKAIRHLCAEEFQTLDANAQNYLLNGIGRGEPDRMVREVVAELVSRNVVPDKGPYDKFFNGSFPKLSKMLNEPGSPFRFE